MILIYDRLLQFKAQSTLWMQIQLPKYIKRLIKVSFVCNIDLTL